MSDNVIRPNFGARRGPEPTGTDHPQEAGYTPEMLAIIAECGNTARANGFKLEQHATTLSMIATEVCEALDWISDGGERHVADFRQYLANSVAELERYRDMATDHRDQSAVIDEDHLYRELADVVIRVFSYAAGNGHALTLYSAIRRKMIDNGTRPHKHGKGF